jgi:hypothetical protein
MEQISELRNSLSQFFDWNKCRLDCLGQMIRALLMVRTINLTQIAAAFQSKAQEESSYRRITTILRRIHYRYEQLGPLDISVVSSWKQAYSHSRQNKLEMG